MTQRRSKKGLAVFLLALWLLTLLPFGAAALEQAPLAAHPIEPPIRVGYFAFEGYHNQDAEGERSGYGYEYLQQMARYTGWTYDYIGYDKSWSDAQTMLENGEIDLLTSAQKTEKREQIFDFSDEPIGYSSTILTVKAGNDRYTVDNLASLDGVRVGLLNGNSRNESFSDFAAEKGFAYVPVMFSSQDALTEALQEDRIDAIVTSSLRAADNEWIMAEFDISPYYVCVKKGNSALLAQVNDAISQINRDNPSLQTELNQKYYRADSSESVAFTEAERSYIAQRIASGEPLRVMLNPDRAPLSYYENGQLEGVFGVIGREVLERSGLPYEVVEPQSRQEYGEFRVGHRAEVLLDVRFDYNQAEREGYRVTNAYYNAFISQVTRKDFSGTVQSVAMIANSDVENRLEQFYVDKELVYYDSIEECVRAVKDGKQDAACLYAAVAERVVRQDVTNHLVSVLLPDLSTSFCFGVCDENDEILFSILNKCLDSLDRNWMDGVAASYAESYQAESSLMALIYDYPIFVLGVVVLLLCLIGLVSFLFNRQKSLSSQRESAQENERLLGYVCRANDEVTEVDLQTMRCRSYSLVKGTLRAENLPYVPLLERENFLHPDDVAGVAAQITPERLDELMRTGGELALECRCRQPDGSYRWYYYMVEGVRPSKTHPRSLMVFKRDIHAMKEQEEKQRQLLTNALAAAEQASQAKGDFMSRMSHEIRTPLNAVIGYLDIARSEQSDTEKVAHCLDQSSVAARHLLSIINDVLDISSIEAGRMKIAHEDFDLSQLIHSLTAIFYAQAKAKGVKFDVTVDGLTEEWVVGDSLRVNQVLMNLLSNAVKFTPAGGEVALAIHQITLHEGKAHLQFCVSDSGIGMSREFLNRMFLPFEQESAATAKNYGGSGLGLSITNNLVKMMGGSLEVESVQGEGTTFTVSMAFGLSKEKHAAHLTTESFSHLRALVVDDEQSACEYIHKLLERCGVKCDTVTSGKKAVRRIQNRLTTPYPYDLCIVDWSMADMDGLETAKQIRALCGDKLPIIIATSYDYSSIVDEAKAAGVNKIISKPLFQSTLFDLLVNTYGKYKPAEKKERRRADFSGIHVLLAEDNAMNLEIAEDILTKAGLRLTTAVNGQEAVDRFTASTPGTFDAILMDIQMPIMDGYEATRAIRKSDHPEAKTIPIIAMTANAFTSDVTAALAAGMNDHVAKPISYDRLFDALDRLIARPTQDTQDATNAAEQEKA